MKNFIEVEHLVKNYKNMIYATNIYREYYDLNSIYRAGYCYHLSPFEKEGRLK